MEKKEVNFWKNVDDELKYNGKNRKTLAREACFDVSNIGKGIQQNNVPAADTAYRIARALNVSIEYLLDGNNSSEKVPDMCASEEMKKFRKYRKVVDDLDLLDESEKSAIINMIAEMRKDKK